MSETKLTIAAAREMLATVATLDDSMLAALRTDDRKGIQLLVQKTERHIQKLADAEAAFSERLRFEREFWANGDEFVAGVDEVGRGPLAGPVVTGAVILPHDFDIPMVNDSKQLNDHQREALYPQILAQAVSVSVGVVSSKIIDDINIYEATRVAMRQAVLGLSVTPTRLIVDAMQIPVPIEQLRLIKGDAKSASVSAASIVAKVYRDHMMQTYDKLYPGYGFANNAGYGTADHLKGLDELGITAIHRRSFAPVKKHLQDF